MSRRLRIHYARGEAAQDLPHREVMRAWERALAIATAAEGEKGARPRVAVAAPLPVGVTSDAEVLDAYLELPCPLADLSVRLRDELPDGIRPQQLEEVGLGLPSLQSDVRWVEYDVALQPGVTLDHARRAVCEFMATETMPWEHQREAKTRRYDIRALVLDLAVEGGGEGPALAMRLRLDSDATGRPEQVVAALGLGAPLRVHRTRLGFGTRSAVIAAWRRYGRFQEEVRRAGDARG